MDYTNKKPYRTRLQKEEARRRARKENGRWVSDAPVSHHPTVYQNESRKAPVKVVVEVRHVRPLTPGERLKRLQALSTYYDEIMGL
jgi:hypothetical protein